MARVTVEDCITIVPNRFDLVLLAAKRAREISAGAPLTVIRDNDKNPVIALREIADETISAEHLKNGLIKDMQRYTLMDEAEDEMENKMIGQEYMESKPSKPFSAKESDDDFSDEPEGDDFDLDLDLDLDVEMDGDSDDSLLENEDEE